MSIRFAIEDLYHRAGLFELHNKFQSFLQSNNQSLYNTWKVMSEDDAETILSVAPYIERFIAQLFSIEKAVGNLHQKNCSFDNIHKCKRLFIQRYALRQYNQIKNFPVVKEQLKTLMKVGEITEVVYANKVMSWWENKENYEQELDCAAQYAVWMVENTTNTVLFKLPKKLDYTKLVDTQSYTAEHVTVLKSSREENRAGFKLTDSGLNSMAAQDQAHYCIFCHKQGRDSCRKGFCNKDGTYRISPTKTTLTGCPLGEKISEMNLLKSQGYNIAALAVITLDNPMCAATGHRICNDCMRSCIYQKQTPVNIPGVETNVLAEVLALPYGFEIYSLLTRWNPLNIKDPLPKELNEYKVLVVGLGPAGFTMAHYLLNQGHVVVGVDGLKIEPLPSSLTGMTQDGKRVPFKPIKDINALYEELDERVIDGFGGVTEYGITVRWNKNYLKVIRLLLERRANFVMYGGVRFGSNLTYNDAISLGFHHIALAIGSGRPNIINVKNNLACGVRMASDFLMSLQLGGAYKADSVANLQIRLPIVVIGGGLTAFDTATEAMHYYSVQVEKFAKNYHVGMNETLNVEEKKIAEEFLQHARLLQASDNKIKTLKSLGGVKILYRKKLQDSPAYRLNHEEVEKALAEGIEFVENFTPTEVLSDKYNNAQAIKGYMNGKETVIFSKTILIAAGNHANTVLSKEDPEHFHNFIDAPRENITILGDLNPRYSGSVVRAIASAKDSYLKITERLLRLDPGVSFGEFFREINSQLLASVVKVEKLAHKIYEIVIRAPLAAKNFSPGQFYRLQNYESNALTIDGKKMLMEGLALTGASVDQDLVSTIVLEVGVSSSVCKYLQRGEQVVLMGPTGTPTEIPCDETIMLVGGGLGNAVLFSIGQAMRQNGCRVLYIAGYKQAQDRYKIYEIENAADTIVWACDERILDKTRSEDFSYHGNIITAINTYHKDPGKTIDLKDVDRMVVIGSDAMMRAVNVAYHQAFKSYFKDSLKMVASINSPMQCMMKEICAQCLQKHVDPTTGEETFVYSCVNQDQDMRSVDFHHLTQRLKQNSVHEKVMMQKII